MLGAKEAHLLALQIHDADEPVLGDERHGKFGADFGVGRDVSGLCRNVIQQQRLTGKRHLAHHPLADRDQRAGNFGGVPYLKAHAQLVRPVVEQQDGKDAVRNQGANQFGGAAEQSLQVERSVQRVGEAHEIRNIGRLNARIDGVERRLRSRWIGRTIVALELVNRVRQWRSIWHWCRIESYRMEGMECRDVGT